jgi:hypothetical protein
MSGGYYSHRISYLGVSTNISHSHSKCYLSGRWHRLPVLHGATHYRELWWLNGWLAAWTNGPSQLIACNGRRSADISPDTSHSHSRSCSSPSLSSFSRRLARIIFRASRAEYAYAARSHQPTVCPPGLPLAAGIDSIWTFSTETKRLAYSHLPPLATA